MYPMAHYEQLLEDGPEHVIQLESHGEQLPIIVKKEDKWQIVTLSTPLK